MNELFQESHKTNWGIKQMEKEKKAFTAFGQIYNKTAYNIVNQVLQKKILKNK